MIESGPVSHVILVHGLAAHRLVMQRLYWNLQSAGYEVENWKYRSVRGSLPELGRDLGRRLAMLNESPQVSAIHLVTHSMGSIVARCGLATQRFEKLQRWVMLAPPNRGSHAARWLAPWLGWFCEPLVHLSDAANSYVNQLDAPRGVEIGVLVAALDHVVRRSSTRLDTQQDWLVLPGPHGALPWRSDTCLQVLQFLQHGRFAHPSSQTSPRAVKMG